MPRMPRKVQDTALLSAALEGLEAQKRRIEEQMNQVRSMLGRRAPHTAAAAASSEAPAQKRELTAAARRRIAAAQKRRWAEYRKKQGKK